MMKIKYERDGRKVLLLGLSHGNLDRLRADGLTGYIKVAGEDVELGAIDILITAAATEQEMMRAFMDGVHAGTKLHIDPRLKS